MVAESIDLSHLTHEERDVILTVLDRNEKIRKQEDLRIQHLVAKDATKFSRKESIKVRTGEWMAEVSKPSFKEKRRGTDVVRSSFRSKVKPPMPYYEPTTTLAQEDQVEEEPADRSPHYKGRKGGRKMGSSRRKIKEKQQVHFAKENYIYDDEKNDDEVDSKKESIPTIVIDLPIEEEVGKKRGRSFEDMHHDMETAYAKAVENEIKEEEAVSAVIEEVKDEMIKEEKVLVKEEVVPKVDDVKIDSFETSDIPVVPGGTKIVEKKGFQKIKRKGSSRRHKDRPTIASDDNRDDIFASPKEVIKDVVLSSAVVVEDIKDEVVVEPKHESDNTVKISDDIFKSLDNVLTETPTYKMEDPPAEPTDSSNAFAKMDYIHEDVGPDTVEKPNEENDNISEIVDEKKKDNEELVNTMEEDLGNVLKDIEITIENKDEENDLEREELVKDDQESPVENKEQIQNEVEGIAEIPSENHSPAADTGEKISKNDDEPTYPIEEAIKEPLTNDITSYENKENEKLSPTDDVLADENEENAKQYDAYDVRKAFDYDDYISGESLVSSINESHAVEPLVIEKSDPSSKYDADLKEAASKVIEDAFEVAKMEYEISNPTEEEVVDVDLDDSSKQPDITKEDELQFMKYEFNDIPDDIVSDDSKILSGISDTDSPTVTHESSPQHEVSSDGNHEESHPDHEANAEKGDAAKKIRKVVKVVKKKIKKVAEGEKDTSEHDSTSYTDDKNTMKRMQRRRAPVRKRVVRKKLPDEDVENSKTPEEEVET